jgi:methylmalonyl-CoA mutase C-terminal domain/subunit
MDELHARGLDDVLVVAGGTIPEEDRPEILDLGISAIFGHGTSMSTAIEYVREHAPVRVSDDI